MSVDQTGSGYSNSTESHRRLEALLAQWQHLDGFINSTEARYNTILMVLVTLLTAGNFYVASNEAPPLKAGGSYRVHSFWSPARSFPIWSMSFVA